jgi:Spy/CpxP family protein refolding chaperone
MNTRRIGIAVFLTLAFVGLSLSSWAAEPAAKGDAEGFGQAAPLAKLITGNIGRLLVLRSELGVTHDQKKKIAEIIKSHRDEIRPVAKEIIAKRRSLQQAVINKQGDETAIRSAAGELGKAVGDAGVLASKIVAQVKPVLTSQQIDRIEKFRVDTQKATTEWLDEMGK